MMQHELTDTLRVVPVIYVCKRCRKRKAGRHAVRVVYWRRVQGDRWWHPTFGHCSRALVTYYDAAGIDRGRYPWAEQCPTCRQYIAGQDVKGAYNPARKCDPRCTGAVGHNCECQCGGRNHGAAFD